MPQSPALASEVAIMRRIESALQAAAELPAKARGRVLDFAAESVTYHQGMYQVRDADGRGGQDGKIRVKDSPQA